MKKAINTQEVTVTVTTNDFNTAELISRFPTLTLRRVAIAMNLNYNMVLKQSKKPVEGAVYDKASPNYEAVDAYINTRTTREFTDSIDWEACVAAMSATVARGEGEAAASKPITELFHQDQEIRLRKDPEVYSIVLLTNTHVVLNPVLSESAPRVLSAATFLHKGPRNFDMTAELEANEAELMEAREEPVTVAEALEVVLPGAEEPKAKSHKAKKDAE